MKFEELVENLEKVEPITFIAIGKHMGFYIHHKIYNDKESGRLLGINYETSEIKTFSEKVGYFRFKQPCYENYFGLSFLNMENSRRGYGSPTECSTLVLKEDCDFPLSTTYKKICAQLKKEGFDVRNFVKKIKEDIEPNLKEQFNLKHKLENIAPVLNVKK